MISQQSKRIIGVLTFALSQTPKLLHSSILFCASLSKYLSLYFCWMIRAIRAPNQSCLLPPISKSSTWHWLSIFVCYILFLHFLFLCILTFLLSSRVAFLLLGPDQVFVADIVFFCLRCCLREAFIRKKYICWFTDWSFPGEEAFAWKAYGKYISN